MSIAATSAAAPVSQQQLDQLQRDGYFIVRNVVDTDTIDTIRAIILEFVTGKREVKTHEIVAELNAMPMDELRTKLRKLGGIGRQTKEIWAGWYACPRVLDIVRHFLGQTIYMKYDSIFLKPARIGGATPWHQDIALWRDVNQAAWNGWLAIDPATRANGCLQFVPGSHLGEVVPHVKYPDAVHAELPRKLVARTIAERGVHHIELQPGDCVMWHSNLWHFSPENTSDQRRIGMGAVWVNPQQLCQLRIRQLPIAMLDGQPQAFPPEFADNTTPLHMSVNIHTALEDIV